jgi:hypothetical protein
MLQCSINALKSKFKGKCEGTAIIEQDIWKAVPGFPRYEVSTQGNIRRNKYTDNLGRTYIRRNIQGRKSTRIGTRVVLCNQGCKDYILARVIATTFYGYPLDTELTVNHIDGNRANNNIGNLELITREENTQHAHEHGLYKTKYIMTILRDTHTGRKYMFDTQSQASKFLGKNTSFIANAKRDNRKVYGKYILEG